MSYEKMEIIPFCSILSEALSKIAKRLITMGVVVRWSSEMESVKNQFGKLIELLSVDNLQGVEKDVIVIHLRNPKDVTYFSALNRFHGALTRARVATYIFVELTLIPTPFMSFSSIKGFGNTHLWTKITKHAINNSLINPVCDTSHRTLTKLISKENVNNN
jgi:hypothetical protein